jgi:hypothetical protein
VCPKGRSFGSRPDAPEDQGAAPRPNLIGLGLPNLNELGWRWRDALIYVTHGLPKEPAFSTAAIIDRVAPVPLGVICSTRDEIGCAALFRASFHWCSLASRSKCCESSCAP